MDQGTALNILSLIIAVLGGIWGAYEYTQRKKRDERIEDKLHKVEQKENKIAKEVKKGK